MNDFRCNWYITIGVSRIENPWCERRTHIFVNSIRISFFRWSVEAQSQEFYPPCLTLIGYAFLPVRVRESTGERMVNESDEITTCLTRRQTLNKMQVLYCLSRFHIFDKCDFCFSLFAFILSCFINSRKCKFYAQLDVEHN